RERARLRNLSRISCPHVEGIGRVDSESMIAFNLKRCNHIVPERRQTPREVVIGPTGEIRGQPYSTHAERSLIRRNVMNGSRVRAEIIDDGVEPAGGPYHRHVGAVQLLV